MPPTMTPKQRVRLALTRRQPDRVPVFVTLKGALARRLADDLGFPFRPAASSILENRLSHHDMLTAMGNDAVGVGYTYVRPMDELPDGRYRDEFGFVYHDVPNAYGLNREIIDRPLAGITSSRDLAGYRFPTRTRPAGSTWPGRS